MDYYFNRYLELTSICISRKHLAGNILKMIKMHFKRIFILIISGYLIILFAGSIYAQDAKKEKEVKTLLSIEAYDQLQTMPDTFLIDVRTRAEYQFIGHPDRAYLFPYMFMTDKLKKVDEGYEYQFKQKNESFVEEISKVFKKTDNLLIISRDGERSALAAKDLMANGFENVVNISDGFEGKEFPFDEKDTDKDKWYKNLARQNKITGEGHRRHNGWQWWGLPWTYEMDPRYLYPPDLR